MPRFFVVQTNMDGNLIEITGKDALHINKVLRAKEGDLITACDKAGQEYSCKIISSAPSSVVLSVLDNKPTETEPRAKVALFQALPKADKMELIIQKSVELGVSEIIPVVTEHTIVKVNEKSANKIQRYNKISESAAKQCGRGIVPKVSEPVSFNQAVDMMKTLDLAFVAYEKENIKKIKDITRRFNGVTIGILIGPEGGFSEQEIKQCSQNNIISVSLGKRILRTETAGFMALTILLYELGEF